MAPRRRIRSQRQSTPAGPSKRASRDAAPTTEDFGGVLAHQVRNVLTGIIGMAQLAQRANEVNETHRMAARIELEARECAQSLQNYLALGRPAEAPPRPCDLNAVVEQTVELIRPTFQMKDVKLAVVLGDGVPPVHGWADQLSQVLLNLLLNALQAIGEVGMVGVQTAHDTVGAILLVTDTGPGIPSDVQDQIFRPFFTTKSKEEGTGLGLYSVAQIVSRHGGSVTLQSEPGSGAQFRIAFPSRGSVSGTRKALGHSGGR